MERGIRLLLLLLLLLLCRLQLWLLVCLQLGRCSHPLRCSRRAATECPEPWACQCISGGPRLCMPATQREGAHAIN